MYVCVYDMYLVCDPVLGDNDKLYVPSSFIPFYINSLLPLSFLATPNQTESSILTNRKIIDLSSAYKSCLDLHKLGVKIVVLTSMTFKDDVSDTNTPYIHVIATQLTNASLSPPSTTTTNNDDNNDDNMPINMLHMKFEAVPMYFSGTGDMTSALLLGWYVKENNLKIALEKTYDTHTYIHTACIAVDCSYDYLLMDLICVCCMCM